MTPAMYFGIRYAVGLVNGDPDLAGLLITGTGDVFAPGGDMTGGGGVDDWITFGAALGMDVTPFDAVRTSAKPVVSAVNGLCQGGGMQIALCSDLSVVSERATFRVPELFRGYADTYYSQMLARLIGPVRTRDLMFTGRVLSAQEALDWGLVTRVVPHEDLLDMARELLAQSCRTAPARPQRDQVQHRQLPRLLRPHRHDQQPRWTPRPGKGCARSRSDARPTGCTRSCGPRGACEAVARLVVQVDPLAVGGGAQHPLDTRLVECRGEFGRRPR